MQMSIGTTASWKGCTVYTASAKPKAGSSRMLEKCSYGSKSLFSVVPPTSGMFLWIAMDFEAHPSFKEGEEETLEMQLWTNLAEAGVLVAPGWYFAANDDVNDKGQGHFRISFSNAEVIFVINVVYFSC